MKTEEFQKAYKRIKQMGDRGSEKAFNKEEYRNMVDSILNDGSPQQKGAMSKLWKSWGDDEASCEYSQSWVTA